MTSPRTSAQHPGSNPFTTGDAWRSFVALETALREFVAQVPLHRRNRHVFSPILGNILVSSSIQLEAAFKTIIGSQYLEASTQIDPKKLAKVRGEIERGKSDLGNYREILEPCFQLSKRRITIGKFPSVYKTVRPFLAFGIGKRPNWWRTYTNLKHDYYANLKQAGLGVVFEALAGLFLAQLSDLNHRQVLLEMNVIRIVGGSLDDPLRRGLIASLCSSPIIDEQSLKNSNVRVWGESELFQMEFGRSHHG